MGPGLFNSKKDSPNVINNIWNQSFLIILYYPKGVSNISCVFLLCILCVSCVFETNLYTQQTHNKHTTNTQDNTRTLSEYPLNLPYATSKSATFLETNIKVINVGIEPVKITYTNL